MALPSAAITNKNIELIRRLTVNEVPALASPLFLFRVFGVNVCGLFMIYCIIFIACNADVELSASSECVEPTSPTVRRRLCEECQFIMRSFYMPCRVKG